uniref:Immunodominant membrane protein n=2 Tax=Candidatus Phytoplasma pyri TaxID=47566 RepID=Q8KWR8_9MOLU|nr:immunodominant membrane protein [Candidatus Phytoplasma pyri]
MEANQQKILIGVGSVVGVLVLYFILAWSMSFWPFSKSKQKIFTDDLQKITFSTDSEETNNIFSKTESDRKKQLKDEFIDKKVEKFITFADQLTDPKITEGDKKTSFDLAIESLKKIKSNRDLLVGHDEAYLKVDANKTTVQGEIKIIIDECTKFKTQIKTALNLE